MSVKKYKLIPASFFENMGKPGEFIMDNEDEGISVKNKTCESGSVSKLSHDRSISDIIDDNMRKTNFKPSTHHVADFKFGKLPQRGDGVIIQNQLNEPAVFPEYKQNENNVQKAFKLKKIDPDLTNLLNNSSISDDLKLKLYTMFQSKYNKREISDTELETGNDDDFMGDIDGDAAGPRKIINKFVDALPNVF